MKTQARRGKTASGPRPTRKGRATTMGGRKIDWPARFGEGLLLALIVAVPLVVDPSSTNCNDIKDVVLGLGVAVALAVWLLVGLRRGGLTLVRSPLTGLALLYGLWAAITVLFSHYRATAISELGRLAAHLGLYLLALATLRDLAQVRRVIGAAALATLPVCIYAFTQAGSTPGTLTVSAGRVSSFLGNPTYLASFLILVLPLLLAAAWKQRPLLAAGFLIPAALAVVCCYFTFSLGVAIGLVVGLLAAAGLALAAAGPSRVHALLPRLLLGAVLLIGIFALGYHALPAAQRERAQRVLHGSDPESLERHLHWQVAQDLFRAHPILGNGYGTYPVASLAELSAGWYAQDPARLRATLIPGYAHNEVLEDLADTGLMGAALFLALWIAFFLVAGRLALRAPDSRWRALGLALVVAGAAFLFQNQFGVTFRQTGAVTYFWIWLAVAALGSAQHGAPDSPAPELIRLRFRPLRAPGLAATGALACIALVALAYVTIRPLQAGVKLQQTWGAALRGQWPETAQLADETLALCPFSPMGSYLDGIAHDNLGDQPKAIAYYERSLAFLPGNGRVHFALGIAYSKLRQGDKSVLHYREAARLIPTMKDYHVCLGQALVKQAKYAEAAEEFRRALALDPSDQMMRDDLAKMEDELHTPRGR